MQDESRRHVTGARPAREGGLRGAFLEPPYPGVWAILAVLLLAGVVAALSFQKQTRVAVAPRPAAPDTMPSRPAEPASAAPEPEQRPVVSVRTLPEPEKKVERPDTAEDREPAIAPKDPAVKAAETSNPEEPSEAAESLPRLQIPPPPPDEPVFVPDASAAPRRRRAPAVEDPQVRIVVPPPPATGRMSIYFDADSSTFARDRRRLPLRVEVYVDGIRRIETHDPEKREFDLGRLPEGPHEVEIVPYVGNAPAHPRRETVLIEPGARSRFKAVLRKEDGLSYVSKFEERD